jgi:bifunctional non-homologous end joining protein LigD
MKTKRGKGPPPETRHDAAAQEFAGVRLTSADKVLYPEQGITKLDLASYYYAIADWVLPHLAGRPLVLVRCPEGRAKKCFFQKHPPPGTPPSLRQIPVREKRKTENYVVVDDVEGLISLAQVGALEVHTWGCRADKLEQPDRLVFDLDPDPAVPWQRVIESAQQVRQFLQELELESFVKTTGGKGLHLVVPIQRRRSWDEAKEFCRRVAELIVKADPQHYTSNMSKRARAGKTFIDYLRNGRGATSIAAYSTRAKAAAPVSTPLTWKELPTIARADQFHLQNVPQRLASLRRDPWEEITKIRQGLSTQLMKKVESLLKI